MTATLDTLWKTFGVLGGLSAAAWLAAVLGLVVGTVTSRSIRSIEVDRSAELRAAELAAAQTAQRRLEGRAVGIRFAEDTAADRADRAGLSAAEAEGAYERAVADELAKIPAYRSRGKQSRTARTTATSGTNAAAAMSGLDATPAADETKVAEVPAPRSLPEAELIVADRYDRANRAIAWTVLSLAVGLCGWEYVRRFNTTFDAVWPVPLAGSPVDGAVAKSHIAEAPRPDSLAAFLATAVRKGESFIVFTAEHPLGGRDRLERFAAGPLRFTLPVRSYPAAAVASDADLAETVFEAAWFGRDAFVLTGAAGADAALAFFAGLLDRRRACRARAHRTLNVAWTLPAAPASGAAARLTLLAAPTNVRWLASPPAPTHG